MPRTDYKLMEGWEFTLDADGKKGYRPVTPAPRLGHKRAVLPEMDQGEAQGFRVVSEPLVPQKPSAGGKKGRLLPSIWISAVFLKTAPYG